MPTYASSERAGFGSAGAGLATGLWLVKAVAKAWLKYSSQSRSTAPVRTRSMKVVVIASAAPTGVPLVSTTIPTPAAGSIAYAVAAPT